MIAAQEQVIHTDSIDQCTRLEEQLIHLCRQWFPPSRNLTPSTTQLPSLTAQMWQARRETRLLRGTQISTLFRGWALITRFHNLHKIIKKCSKENKRQKLDTFLKDSADLAMQHRTYDWFKSIHKLSPKQPQRCIQMYDNHGHPLNK